LTEIDSIDVPVSLAVVSLLVGLAVASFGWLWRTPSRFRSGLARVLVLFFATAYVLIALEFVFANFMIQSDGVGRSLSARKWKALHWQPRNALGYRDREHRWQQRTLFVVGDSFAAGAGIEQIADRFADVLGTMLGDEWTVAVLAKPGWNTLDEHSALARHPRTPDRIIVSYYINDIEPAALARGLRRPLFGASLEGPAATLVERSYLLNWIYWRLSRSGAGVADAYWAYLSEAFENEEIRKIHEAHLVGLIDYARKKDIGVSFVVWPYLRDPEQSRPFTDEVVRVLREQQVETLDLARHFEGRDPADLVVNPMDAHPNERIHREVARLIHERLGPWRGGEGR
jgi:hypothetical protein